MQRTSQTNHNFGILKQSLADQINQATFRSNSNTRKGKGRARKLTRSDESSSSDNIETIGAELEGFVDYLATEIFDALSEETQSITYGALKDDTALAEKYSCPLSTPTLKVMLATVPPAVTDSLEAYSFVASVDDLPSFFAPVFEEYVKGASIAPRPHDPSNKATECEICLRDWIPLTYHHLIPRQVHAKALKRGWHEAWQLNAVAWLCRACHNFVHDIASNEELARELWSIDRLTARQDVQEFATWLSRVRWKPR